MHDNNQVDEKDEFVIYPKSDIGRTLSGICDKKPLKSKVMVASDLSRDKLYSDDSDEFIIDLSVDLPKMK